MTQPCDRICILGGGFGGLYTALRLDELYWPKANRPEIVLVDQRDRFLFTPLLYELMTGELQTWEIAPPYAEILADTTVRFIQAEVTAIDLAASQVNLSPEQTLTYDRLVLALGGETPKTEIPGIAEHALAFRTLEDAYQLEARLRHLEASDVDKIRIAIVGGGYSGVELACKLADRLGDRGRLRLIDRGAKILRNSPEFNRESAMRALTERNVWLDLETQIESVSKNTISLVYKGQVDVLPVDIVLWTVGTCPHPAVAALPLTKTEHQQLVVASTLQIQDHPHLFALGDLADCRDAEGKQVPNTAQAAYQEADYVAWNLWASMTDRPLLPFRYQNLGEMMTLGTTSATLTGLGLKLDGSLAYVARRLAYLSRMPTLDHQLRVGLNWLFQPVQDLVASLGIE